MATVQLYDGQGRPISLGRQLGSGGEGAVFELGSDGKVVAKVYHKPISGDKSEKLRSMVAMASPELTKFAAWPIATLHRSPAGPIGGIILPRVSSHEEIHNLYSPAHRKLKYPDKDWSFLVHVAMNCAASFDAIHSKSCAIGDVNQGNVLVSQQGTVFLIDCDSFQIRGNGRLFLCEVGVPQYTPPELQGRSFHGVQRTANHDRFGLAVLLFHLLFMGRHPFAGRFLARGEMPIERAITEFRFAFSHSAPSFQMARPPDTLPLEQIAPQLAPLFERAFCKGSEQEGARPGAKDWYNALSGLRGRLRQCIADRGHRFFSQLGTCPWCDLVKSGAPNFFFSVTVHATTAGVFTVTVDVARLWQAIEAIPRPRAPIPGSAKIAQPVIPAPPPSVESSRGLVALVRRVAAGSLVMTVLAAALPVVAYFSIPVMLVFGVWWALLVATSPYNKEKSRRRRTLTQKYLELGSGKDELQNAVAYYEREFGSAYDRLANAKEVLARLKTDYHSELEALERTCKDRQCVAFLQSKFISDYQIDKIGPGREAVLASYGIATAHDIELSAVTRIPGFGPALTATLLAWRRTMESQFRFDAAKGIPASDRQSLNLKYAQRRQQLEHELRAGPETLRGIIAKSRPHLGHLSARVAVAEHAVAQAQADVAAMR